MNGAVGKVGFFHLMILDTNSGKIVDTCLEQEDYPSSLVWSPNGDQVAAGVNYHASDDTRYVVIADVEQKYAVKITDRFLPIGWLVKAP